MKAVNDYLVCALWSSVDDDGTPFDSNFTICDIEPDSVAKAEKDLAEFTEKAGSLLDGLDMTQVAHDLWLTRNRHGAGFWDGDYPDAIGETLTELAHDMGEAYVYLGDDGKLYID